MVPCGDFGVCGQVLPGINHLYLVDSFQYHRAFSLGEQVTQSMPSGKGRVPLVSIQICFPPHVSGI